jgi:hypothetical protein
MQPQEGLLFAQLENVGSQPHISLAAKEGNGGNGGNG